jgi:D-serine deaminase-like pyridoxal phosphate-dependent protein
MKQFYEDYKKAVAGQRLPLAYVDMDLLDSNILEIRRRLGDSKIRLATKSIRSVAIIQYIAEKFGNQCSGYMCFHPEEVIHLANNGLDHLLIAYPYYRYQHFKELVELIKNGKTIYFMVDSIEQVRRLQDLGTEFECQLKLCVDIDMSTVFGPVYFGVYRSSVKNITKLKNLLKEIKKSSHLDLKAAMGYEAQIAGVGDNNPFQKLLNYPIRLLKKISLGIIHKRRASFVQECRNMGFELDFVNGGGTGSIESTRKDASVTEVAVGSGFFSPALFDYYKNFKHKPAAGYAVEITRRPQSNTLTCGGGGYVASGAAGKDKLPVPYLPVGCQLIDNEGTGEVQTPIYYYGENQLKIGDPVFFRHSKAGELCERFNQLHLLRNNKIEKQITTYRGDGKCFL